MPCALITGITGQDGSYLAELLLSKGYDVHGTMRRNSTFTTSRIEHIRDRLTLHYADMTDGSSLSRAILDVVPDEVYNLAAQSHVAVSFDCPEYSADVDGMGVIRLLEAARHTGAAVYQASTSEMFGNAPAPQSERTPMLACSPYAASKLMAHQICGAYRTGYGMRISCGILFNHESPRRGETFVTRKLSLAAARCKLGLQTEVTVGNLGAARDWGYAPEYVDGMWRMTQRDEPGDYVLATGSSATVRDWAEVCFEHVGLDYRAHVRQDPGYLRPVEVDALRGDATRAREVLGWAPVTGWRDLARLMVEHDLEQESHRGRIHQDQS